MISNHMTELFTWAGYASALTTGVTTSLLIRRFFYQKKDRRFLDYFVVAVLCTAVISIIYLPILLISRG